MNRKRDFNYHTPKVEWKVGYLLTTLKNVVSYPLIYYLYAKRIEYIFKE